MAEQLIRNEQVVSSILTSSSKRYGKSRTFFIFKNFKNKPHAQPVQIKV